MTEKYLRKFFAPKATALTAGTLKMDADIRFTATDTKLDGSVQSDPFDDNKFSGLVPSDANLFYHKKFAILTTATEAIDLDALTDALGNAVAFAVVYGFLIQNVETTTGKYVFVGGTGGDFETWVGAIGDKVKLGPKGVLMLCSNVDGYAVTAATGDVLAINNPTGGTVNVKVTIVGKA